MHRENRDCKFSQCNRAARAKETKIYQIQQRDRFNAPPPTVLSRSTHIHKHVQGLAVEHEKLRSRSTVSTSVCYQVTTAVSAQKRKGVAWRLLRRPKLRECSICHLNLVRIRRDFLPTRLYIERRQ